MNAHNAMIAARELTKAYLEHQDVPKWGTGAVENGKNAGEFVKAMLTELSAYFQKYDA